MIASSSASYAAKLDKNDNVIIMKSESMASANPQFDILGFGECMVEFTDNAPPGHSESFRRAYGGDVLNALIAAARSGAKSGFITRVGDDSFGSELLRAWQQEGIDVSHAALVPGENGIYFVTRLANGEREFCYRRQGSAASQFTSSDLDARYIASTGFLLLSGITQAISAHAQTATLDAARIARNAGVRVAYDPNYREKLWVTRGGLVNAQHAFDEVLPYVDWLLPSYPADVALLRDPVTGIMPALRKFAQHCPNVGMKCGAKGSYLALQEEFHQITANSVTSIVDSTGAGDAWNGSLLAALARDCPALDAARKANHYAASTLTSHGAIAPQPLIMQKENSL